MKHILTILFLSINLIVSATKYYVATDGNDSNSGDITHPWKTWGKAFNASVVNPGDTIYFRGGTYYKAWGEGDYYHSDGKSYRIDNAGTVGNYVNFWNYPDEVPILDCDNIVPTTTLNYAIRGGADYTYFKGLHIRNVWSVEGGIGGTSVQCIAWKSDGNKCKIENCKIYNIHGIGLELAGGGDTMYVTNCDAWNCCDSFAITPSLPGNRGSGFATLNTLSTTSLYYFTGCRAWNCGDQGFVGLSVGDIEWDSCWSFLNGQLQGEGHGFKLGWATTTGVAKTVTNCISAYNRSTGFTTNEAVNHPYTVELTVYNSTAYKNGVAGYHDTYPNSGVGFVIYKTSWDDDEGYDRVFKNNISYGNKRSNEVYVATGALYTHSNNSWDASVTVTDADFVSVDSTGLAGVRGENGALPDLDFLELTSTSDLIDAGTDVGLDYNNDAPDIGFFEYPTFPETSAPYINTNEPIRPTTRFAYDAGGNMISAGGGTISAKGIVYSQEVNPTTADSVIICGTGTDDFTTTIKPLTANTTYHVRAYATNETGTAYGADVEFTTPKQSYLQYKGKKVIINYK